MDPLRITFLFDTDVSPSDTPTHLDGLLAWAAVQIAVRDDEQDLDRAAAALPLARRGKPPVWCASTLDFEYTDVPSLRLGIRRTDVEDYARAMDQGQIHSSRARDQLNTGSGPLRNFLYTVPTRPCRQAQGWCLGDRKEIENLLKEIHHIGKYGRMGCGNVKSFKVENDDAAKTKWKRRHLPWAEPGYLPMTGNFEAPYWDRTRMTKIYVPA